MKKIVRSVSGVTCMAGLLGLFGAAGASDRGADLKQLVLLMVISFTAFMVSAAVLRATK